jgi:hypothetical protein
MHAQIRGVGGDTLRTIEIIFIEQNSNSIFASWVRGTIQWNSKIL